jgi:hypothetical protein
MQQFRRSFLAWLGMAVLVGAALAPMPAAAQSSGWQPGPGAVLDNTYDGFIDVPAGGATVSTNGFGVSGWFVDKMAQGWAGADDVQVWLGTQDGGGRMLAKAIFAQSRPDVANALGNPYWAASGFFAFIPAGAVPAGSQTLTVYAHTPGKGSWFKQVTVNASESAPAAAAPPAPAAPGTPAAPAPTSPQGAAPILVIEAPKGAEIVKTSTSDYQIIGYALDPNAAANQGSQGTGIDHVAVYMDADKDDPKTIFLGDAELAFSSDSARLAYGDKFTSAGWRLSIKPTKYTAKGHQLFVYAHSVVTNKETLELRGFDIREP